MTQGCYCQTCKRIMALKLGQLIPRHLDAQTKQCSGAGSVPRLLSAGLYGGPWLTLLESGKNGKVRA